MTVTEKEVTEATIPTTKASSVISTGGILHLHC